MPLKTCWTFERGSAPEFSPTMDLNNWMAERDITEEILHPSSKNKEETDTPGLS